MVGSEDGAVLWNFQSFKDFDNFHAMIVLVVSVMRF